MTTPVSCIPKRNGQIVARLPLRRQREIDRVGNTLFLLYAPKWSVLGQSRYPSWLSRPPQLGPKLVLVPVIPPDCPGPVPRKLCNSH
jgi:hypothetical protein